MKVTGAHRGILRNLAVLFAINVFQFCASSPLSEETTKITETPSNNTILPPLIFPSDTTVYKIVTGNETALKILQDAELASTEASIKVPKTEDLSTEVTPAKKVPESTPASSELLTVTSEAPKKSTTSSEEDDYEYTEEKEDSDVEDIQTTKQKPEDGLEENFGNHDGGSLKIDDSVVDAPIFHNGHFAGMFAGLLVVLSVACYIGLVLWRSRLEKKYGMRERLVTEDDYYHNNDTRYFGL